VSNVQATLLNKEARRQGSSRVGAEETLAPESAPESEPEYLRLSTRERLALLGQLSVMLESGLQVPAALQAMREQSDNPRVADVLTFMENTVRSGQTLSSSVIVMPRAFPELVGQMIAAGEKAGRLAEMILRLVEMLEAEEELRGRVRSALLYPSIMMIVACAVVVFLVTFIVPKFSGLFRGKEAALPLPTRILMGTGEFFSANALWLLPSVLALIAGTVLFLKSKPGKPYLDSCLLRLPIIREVYCTAILSRTSRTLGTLVQAGVAILTALEHTRDVAGSPAFAKLWAQVRHNVGNGGTISEAIRQTPLLPSTYKQMVGAGEATARLDHVLIHVAGHYSSELQRKVRDITTIVEPVLVVFMGVVVGFIALSIMLPIFQLSRNG
jgi:type IV pilus assembly protein PilC